VRQQLYFEKRNPISKSAPATLICEICEKPKSPHDRMMAELIRPSLLEFIKSGCAILDGNGFLEEIGRKRES
jgi:hypothetical protein